MLSAIDQAIQNGYKSVVFTGGEPTLSGEDLIFAIKRAASAGLNTRVVTNAWWAMDEESALRHALSFVSAGLREINFSTGDQHAAFVPLQNVLRACRACLHAGLRSISIMVETVKTRGVTAESLTDDPDFKRLLVQFPSARLHVLESPWMPMSPYKTSTYQGGMVANRANVASRPGCNSCLSTTTVQADGRIAACCGLGMRTIPELQIGHIEKNTLTDADGVAADDFLKRWIRIEGPERILAWAAEHDEDIQWENMYAHRCQACLRLYKDPRVRAVIKQHHREKISDIVTAEWLLYAFDTTESGSLAGTKDDSFNGGIISRERPNASDSGTLINPDEIASTAMATK
jgi:hypothetical protein